MTHVVAVLPGDGIGPEVTAQSQAVLQEVAVQSGIPIDFEHALIGGAAVDACGDPLPDSTADLCARADAVLLGAVGGPRWESHPVYPAEVTPAPPVSSPIVSSPRAF